MKIVWSPRAIKHLSALRGYIEADNISAASAVVAKIVESVDRLADQPHSGRPGRLAGTRGARYFVRHSLSSPRRTARPDRCVARQTEMAAAPLAGPEPHQIVARAQRAAAKFSSPCVPF
jgi:plasmid stabilization system protein ParE